MRTAVRVERSGEGRYRLLLTPAQRDLMRTVVEVMELIDRPDAVLQVQTGTTRAGLAALGRRLDARSVDDLTVADLHALHAVLTVAGRQFPPSEEAFHLRVGFYRENATDLAAGLVSGLGKAVEGGTA